MGGWFTVEQIDGDTFAISEYKHWEETHCYLLCGKDRAVLIDTGLGVSDIKNIVNAGLLRKGCFAKLHIFNGMWHDFMYMFPRLKESKTAWNEVFSFMRG